ncbi:MAG: mechanosensitive ion channel family protein [Vulcanimicrobiota bacterium]
MYNFLAITLNEALQGHFFLFEQFSNQQILMAAGAIVVGIIINKIVHYFVSKKMKKLAEQTESDHDDNFIGAIETPLSIFIYLWFFYLALQILDPTEYMKHINKTFFALVAIDVTWLLLRMVDVGTKYMTDKYTEKNPTVATALFPLINKTIKIFLVLITFILIVQNLGYSVSSLLAGLGIGGIAVAMAAKDTLANIFGSFMIFIDRPFVIGDWIVVNDVEGTVEDVGFRTTKIRTFAKNEVSIPNNIVANTSIQNFSRRPQRRISTTIGVTYGTPPEKLEQAIERIKQIIFEHPNTSKETILVYFSEFSASSLGIFCNFFINSSEWVTFLEARQEIYISIMRAFNELDIDFAFPSQSIYLENSEDIIKQLKAGKVIETSSADTEKK